MSEIDDMRHALWERGVLPHHPDRLPPHIQARYPDVKSAAGVLPMWRTELGHNVLFMPPDNDGGWHFTIRHHGDPSMTMLQGDLGDDVHEAAEGAARVFTDRNVMGHLRDMYQRARLNNDPTGLDEAARRHPATGRTSDVWVT